MVAQTPQVDPRRVEALGPAERVVQTLTTYTDHLFHGRPGVVTTDPSASTGVRWEAATWKLEGGEKVVYFKRRAGKREQPVRAGVLAADNTVVEGGRRVGEYRLPGLVPEVAAWMYNAVAEVYTMDQEFAARWASWAFAQGHRDLKVVLAAFMLVQARKGDPVRGADGAVELYDEDYRDVGEAMCLLRAKKDDINPKLLARIEDLLRLPAVAAINRRLSFARSARNPTLGRYDRVVAKWLRHREVNPKMLDGLVSAGFTSTVRRLAERVHYKPESPRFFEALRWAQKQSVDGRRTIAVGKKVRAAESWAKLTEEQICERVVSKRPDWKRIVGLLPREIGVTRAIVTAAVEAGGLSDADLVILTPTLEELGLLDVPAVKARWARATAAVENQRAAHIATRVRKAETAAALAESADRAAARAVAEVVRNLRIHVLVDKSGSMAPALEAAKRYVKRMLPAFPLERLHIVVFNTVATEVTLRAASAAAVEVAFAGHHASGGTFYHEGVRRLAQYKPAVDEDLLMVFVGDEADHGHMLAPTIEACGLRPVALGLIRVEGNESGSAVRDAARALGVPCLRLEESMFEDAYAFPRILRGLIGSTPVTVEARRAVSLVEQILTTPLLEKPAWAA